MTDIDLSQLPAPTVVEPLDFETILAALTADFRGRYPEFDAFVESDPALKLLETAAYREMLLRWRINEAAKSVMIAFAKGSNLDHLVALAFVERDGDEDDDRLLRRFRLSLDALSVAGPRGAYEFHALSADSRVESAKITTPTPGAVDMVVLGGDADDGLPDAALVAKVAAALSTEKVRPLTDTVSVSAARNICYQVVVTIYVGEGPDSSIVRTASEAAVRAYLLAQHRVGGVVYKTAVEAAAHVAGVTHTIVEFRFDDAAEYAASKIDFADSALAIPSAWQAAAAPWPARPASVAGDIRFPGYSLDTDGTAAGDVATSDSADTLVIQYLAGGKDAIDAAFAGAGARVRVAKDANNYRENTIHASTAPAATATARTVTMAGDWTAVGTVSEDDDVALEILPLETLNAARGVRGYKNPATAPADGLTVTLGS